MATLKAGFASFRGSALARSALGAAMAIGALTAGQAQAVVVHVPGYGSWDVTTFSGTYNADPGKFNNDAMPWLQNKAVADAFATAVGSSLGFPNNFPPFNYGPLFPYLVSPSTLTAVAWQAFADTLSAPILVTKASLNTWATAAPVPAPLPLLGAAAAFSTARRLRRRLNGEAGQRR